MALLFTKAGDVESNLGTTTHTKKHSPAYTPVIWICDFCDKPINKKINQMYPHTQHTLGSSKMHTDKTPTIQTRLEMHHSHTNTTRNNNANHIQHNSPSTTKHLPPPHKQQSTTGQIPQQPTTQQSHKYHTTHRASLRNNTPQSNPSYPVPTQNKQMSPTTFIFKQDRRRQTPISTMPPLQIRTTHDNTFVQLYQHKHTTQCQGFVDGSHGSGESAN